MDTVRKPAPIKTSQLLCALVLSALSSVMLPVFAAHPTEIQPHAISLGKDQVFYVTDRQQESGHTRTTYNAERSEQLDYGLCSLSDKGIAESTSDDDKSRSRMEIDPPSRFDSQQAFFENVENAQAECRSKRVILFVHGYDCSFQKAVKLAAGLAHQTVSPVVLFSWPSRNKKLTYLVDECNAEWSSSQFSELLQAMSARFGKENMTIVAHSMGTQIVCSSLQALAFKDLVDQVPLRKYGHIVFCSPDLDTQTFLNRAPVLVRAAKDISVLVSTKDARLGVSRFVHGNSRLGSSKKGTPTVDGVRFIDFTAQDHSTFGHQIPYELVSELIDSASTQITLSAEESNL